MQSVNIVVTRPEYVKAAAVFDAQPDMVCTVVGPDEPEVAEAIRRTRACAAVLGVEKYTDVLYEALPRGGVISRFGVGHDGIDKPRATRAGLFVTNTPGVLEDAVAEHALALMLAITKCIPAFVRSSDARQWVPLQTTELRGKTLAILGCGAIGRRVSRLASRGFGMTVIGYDLNLDQKSELIRQWEFADVGDDLGTAIAEADYISLHIPSLDSTHHFVDAAFLSRLRPGAVLINTARGAVVDEVALWDALHAGALRAAALDVFETEPYLPRDSVYDLRELPNVLMTPHVSSGTREACARVARASLDNIRNSRAGHFGSVSLLNRDVLREANPPVNVENDAL